MNIPPPMPDSVASEDYRPHELPPEPLCEWCGKFEEYHPLLHRGVLHKFAPPSTSPSLGSRTAADLKYGPPPKPLMPPFFTTESALTLYGPGGVGKGTMACHIIREYLNLDIGDVMVLDFEGHESEWGNRLRGLGAGDADLARIHYREPFGGDWDHDANTLAGAAKAVQTDCQNLGVTLLVIDSIVMASDGDAAMGGAAAAKAYFAGLASIGLRSLNLGHVAGAAEKWPAKPFGSAYVHNLSRETWAIERVGDSADEFVPEDEVVFKNSSSFKVELRNRKNSEGALQRPVVYEITYWSNGDLSIVPATNVKSIKDKVRDALMKTPGLSQAAIVKAIKEDTGEVVNGNSVGTVLSRNPKEFVTDSTSRPFLWKVS